MRIEATFTGQLTEVGLAWRNHDKLHICGDTAQEFVTTSIDGNKATLVGKNVEGNVFDIVMSKHSDFMTKSYLRQEQTGLSSTSHLQFDFCLKGVKNYENITFSDAWAQANGGVFLQSGCLFIDFELPENTDINRLTGISLEAGTPVFHTSNTGSKSSKLELAVKEGYIKDSRTVKAYLSTPIHESVLGQGIAIKLVIDTDNGMYSKSLTAKDSTIPESIIPGKVNTIQTDSKGWTMLKEYKNLILMSYNVGNFKKFMPQVGHYTYPEAAALVKSCRADVVGLNETSTPEQGFIGDHQPKELAEAIGEGWTYYFARAKNNYYGNAIVASPRHKAVSSHRIELPCTASTANPDANYETRSMGVVEYQDHVFCVTHLDHNNQANRNQQIGIINKWIQDNYGNSDKPIFLAGDMNCEPTAQEITMSLGRYWELISATDIPTYSGKCIDYIFLWRNDSIEYTINSTGAICSYPDINVDNISDHFPVYADLKLIISHGRHFKDLRTDLRKSENP